MSLGGTHGRAEDFVNAFSEVEDLVAVEGEVGSHCPGNRAFEDTCVNLDVESLVLNLGITKIGGRGCRTGNRWDSELIEHIGSI